MATDEQKQQAREISKRVEAQKKPKPETTSIEGRIVGKIPQGENSRKKLNSVVKGGVKKKEVSTFKKFGQSFLGEDGKSVGFYILEDVLIPALKAMVNDMVAGGIERLLFGTNSGRSVSRYGRNDRNRTSYSRYYHSDGPQEHAYTNRRVSSSARSRFDFSDLILVDRGEADEVLGTLYDLIEEYGVASVADLYDLVGEASDFTDIKYGWEDLGRAGVRRVRDGYLLDLPKPRPI